MLKTFKVLALLLTYPDEEITLHAHDLRSALREEALLPKPLQTQLEKLIEELKTRDLYELQERYVLLFDRTRSLSLHLFEHIHGEGRDRGKAMLDLKAHYERHGFEIAAPELPDFLPLFLEFLSTLKLDSARDLLSEPRHIVCVLRQRLQRRRSVYAPVFRALETLASGKSSADNLRKLIDIAHDNPDDFDQLDRTWEDTPVSFGPDAAVEGCNPNRIAARLRAAKRPAAGIGLPGRFK